MTEEQPCFPVTPGTLVGEVKSLQEQGWRLVQIGITSLGALLELNYSFDREQQFRNLRLQVSASGPRLPSVSGIYWCAFLYENEIHDLFGVTFEGLVLDFQGTLYKTAQPFPFKTSARTGVSTTVVQSV